LKGIMFAKYISFMISNNEKTTTTEQIRQMEKAETIAFQNADFASLNEIWHPDFTVNSPLDRLLKPSDIQGAMNAGMIKYSSLERNIEEITVHNQVAISMGNEVTFPIENAPDAGTKVVRRFTNIWIKEGAAWKMFARHASNINTVGE
jgi:hypothetical protein